MNILYNTKNFINFGRKRIREKKIIGFSILLLIVLLFFSTAGFQDKLIQGWYQQWLPDLNGSSIKDITFLDSLTGFAVTNTNSLIEGYVIKTTNSGDNWSIVYTYHPPATSVYLNRLQFAGDSTGYITTNYFDVIKTTDGGTTWTAFSNMPWGADDMSLINKDTVLAVTNFGPAGGVYRTTNGGSNWQLIWTNGTSGNPNKIYMFNKNFGFHCGGNLSYLRRTTNGGLNWTDINDIGFSGICFYDSLIGWKGSIEGIKKTTNGGLNWVSQQHSQVTYFRCDKILMINKDSLWFVGCTKLVNNIVRGVISRTTNSGLTWGYQIPDTTIHIYDYYFASIVNKNNIWAYFPTTGVHTNTGGNDTTYYTGIGNHTSIISKEFELFQNYPNPFNSISKIKYKISKIADVKISVFDISGKEVTVLINKRHTAGLYNINFDGGGLPSGVYFYALLVNSEKKDIRKMILVK